MKFIKSVNGMVNNNRVKGGNSFWNIWGDILQDDNGNYYYQEFVKENPRIALVSELPLEVQNYILSTL